jgi:hypothetical protein
MLSMAAMVQSVPTSANGFSSSPARGLNGLTMIGTGPLKNDDGTVNLAPDYKECVLDCPLLDHASILASPSTANNALQCFARSVTRPVKSACIEDCTMWTTTLLERQGDMCDGNTTNTTTKSDTDTALRWVEYKTIAFVTELESDMVTRKVSLPPLAVEVINTETNTRRTVPSPTHPFLKCEVSIMDAQDRLV